MSSLRILVYSIALVCIAPVLLTAQATTAFRTGEQTTGMTKQCFYNALGSTYTKTIGSIELCPLSIQVESRSAPSTAPTQPTYSTITARLQGEKTTEMTKQCFYDHLGSEYTKTISSVALCPLTAEFNRR